MLAMLSRRNWITEFIGHVLHRGLSDNPSGAVRWKEIYAEIRPDEPPH